jgi:hypothetical protein
MRLCTVKKQADNFFDSEPEEDLDMTPEWLKERPLIDDELEDTLKKLPFRVNKVTRGQSRGVSGYFAKKATSNVSQTGKFKNIIKVKQAAALESSMPKSFKQFLTQQRVVARLYVLKGKSFTPKDATNSDPYLVIKLGDKVITDKESLRPNTNNPGFFRSYDIPTLLPGTCTLKIECWDDDGFDFDDLIGETKIDLEDRFFCKEWKKIAKLPKMPIEHRTLFIQKSAAPQGILECWVEIMDPKMAAANPAIDVSPPPKEDWEVRVIVWGTRDVTFADEATKCNDLYVKGSLAGLELETDTHWRCRSKGSFNWRWKFPLTLPLDPEEDYGKDTLQFQLWDKDILAANDMICETRVELNDFGGYRMLDK